MQKTRKYYADVIATLNMRINLTGSSLVSYANKLTKLAYTTEDTEIQSLLLSFVAFYNQAYIFTYNGRPRIMFTKNRDNKMIEEQFNKEVNNLRDRIIQAINMRIALNKPEWQILAEKHGWRP